jgi:membrane protease YdiL (CAAX protease family)
MAGNLLSDILYLGEARFKIPVMDGVDNTFPKRVWGPWTSAGFGFVVGVVYFATYILTVFALSVGLIVFSPTFAIHQLVQELAGIAGLLIAVSSITTAIVCSGLITIIIKVRRGLSIKDYLGLKPVSRKAVFLSLAIIVVLIILTDLISVIINRPVNSQFMLDIYNSSVWPVLLWIGIVVFAPIFEEILFRGFLFAGFINSRLGLGGALVLTSLIWTSLHVQYGVYELVVIFISGILLGMMRHKTGSLWTSLLMHSFMNLVAMIEVALNMNSLIG